MTHIHETLPYLHAALNLGTDGWKHICIAAYLPNLVVTDKASFCLQANLPRVNAEGTKESYGL